MALVCVSSCGPSKVGETLADVESFMDERPDSALAVLRGVEVKDMNRASERALYAVLLTQALDKNHEPLAETDSIISEAVEFYSRHSSDIRRFMLANYFNGRVKYQTEDYPESLVAMFKAHDLATEIDDKFWMGMSARGIADVYYDSYNSDGAVEYAKIEYECLKQYGRQPYINYALYDLASAYSANTYYKNSLAIAKQVLDSATYYNDIYLGTLANGLIGLSFLGDGSPGESLQYFENVCNSGLASKEDSIYLSYAYLKNGETEEALRMMDVLENSDDLKSERVRYRFYREAGHLHDAMISLERVDSLNNAIFEGRIKVNLTKSVLDHYALEKNKKEIEVKESNIIICLLIVILVLTIVCVILIAGRYYRNYKAMMQRNLAIANNLHDVLELKDTECSKARATVRSLLDNKVRIFDDFCRAMYESHDAISAEKRISKAVSQLINGFGVSSKAYTDIEKIVDKSYDNVMADLRADLPKMKEVDYALFLYSALGFSISAISIFIKEERISAIYERKRRLKDKLKKLDVEKSQRYISFIK